MLMPLPLTKHYGTIVMMSWSSDVLAASITEQISKTHYHAFASGRASKEAKKAGIDPPLPVNDL